MEILGYIMALFVGITLGLIGGGGSILAVPILAYVFSFDEKIATAYSLFTVGSAALLGGWRQHRHQLVDWRTAIVFGIPAIIGVWFIRHYVVPILPDILFEVGSFSFTRRMGMFGLFSLLMLWASFSMLSSKEDSSVRRGAVNYNYPLILIEGLVVGTITGFVGAGGGFLIIPALVILANLDFKKAVGTSLIIIALKSLLGFFLGDALTTEIDWHFLLLFSGLTNIGILIGIFLSKFIDGRNLKKGFGYFILAMAFFVFAMEFLV